MKRGKDEDKFMVPMFPRLHVHDTDTGGPRAPPRNKMALYEQLSIPSQRFSNGALPFNTTNSSNREPSASTGQGTRNERQNFFSRQLPPRHQTEKSYSQHSNLSTSSAQSEQKKKLDEDDFTVPIFNESHSNQDHGKRGLDMEKSSPSNHADSLKFPNGSVKDLKETSMALSSRNQEGNCLKEVSRRKFVAAQELMDETLLNLSSMSKTESLRKQIDVSQSAEPRENPATSIDRIQKVDNNILLELCAESQPAGCARINAVIRGSGLGIKSRHSLSSRDFQLEEQNVFRDVSDDMTSSPEEGSCRSAQMKTIERTDSVSETSMVDSVPGLGISPDDVVGKIGKTHFWKARRAIANQQRDFEVQVFELHRLIKVQRLIAASPHLLLEDAAYLVKPVKISPAKKLPLDYISKSKSNSKKPNPNIEHSAENTVGKTPPIPVENMVGKTPPPYTLQIDTPPLCCNDHNTLPWFFNQPQGHQWLIPVMSPSEGLVYKPYPGPGFAGAICGAPLFSPWTSNFSTHGYGVPVSNHEYQVSSFPPAGPHSYFPNYSTPFANLGLSGSSVEQMNHFNVVKKNKQHTSTASSPTERPQGSRDGHAFVGRNALPLFPATPAVNNPDFSVRSPEPEHPAQVIKVVPRNARSATESAARIFQSIQEERKQYE